MHAASAAARLAGRGPSNAAPHVQIDALGIVPGPADHFVHTSPLCVVYFKYSKRIYSCGQITLDPQNFGRKQKRSKLQSDLVVRIFHTRLRLNSKIFVPGQIKVSCGHSHDEIRLGN